MVILYLKHFCIQDWCMHVMCFTASAALFDINTSVATETNHFSLQFVSYLEECGEEPISCLTSISGWSVHCTCVCVGGG